MYSGPKEAVGPLSGYLILSGGVLLAMAGRVALTAAASLWASLVLHREMLSRVLRAPMAWFEATPMGR
jgi:hypothetical protein